VTLPLVLLPEAEGDIRETRRWYERQRPGLGAVYYEIESDQIVIQAVWHLRRAPGSWRERR
jgi:plasmid stabilization system protein ParE